MSAAPSIKPAAKSKPAAAPVASQAKGTKGTDTGKTEVEYELPSAEEIEAHLPIEPAKAKKDDDDEDDELEDVEPEAKADAKADGDAEEPAAEDAAEKPDESEKSEDDAEKGEETAEKPDETEEQSEEKTEEQAETEEAAAPEKTRTQERIDGLTARAKTAEEESARLREQLAESNFQPTSATGPLAKIDRLAELEATAAKELRLHTWALRNEGNADGADLPDGKGGTTHFDADEIRAIKANTFENLYEHVPARRAYLQEKAQRENDAVQAYPWLTRLNDGDGAAVQKLIESRPYLRQGADYRLLAADAVVGAKLRSAGIKLDDKTLAQLAKGKPVTVAAAAKPRAAVVTKTAPIVRRTAGSPQRPGVLPNRLDRRDSQARAADKRMAASDGNLDSIADSIAANWR